MWYVGFCVKEEIGKDGVIGMVQEVYGEWNVDLNWKFMVSLDFKDWQVEDEEVGDVGEVSMS